MFLWRTRCTPDYILFSRTAYWTLNKSLSLVSALKWLFCPAHFTSSSSGAVWLVLMLCVFLRCSLAFQSSSWKHFQFSLDHALIWLIGRQCDQCAGFFWLHLWFFEVLCIIKIFFFFFFTEGAQNAHIEGGLVRVRQDAIINTLQSLAQSPV